LHGDFVFLSAFVSSVSASTRYVPDDYTTIQAAVDAAGPEDVILIRDGTYKENVKVNKAHLTIKSENGTDKTTVEYADDTDNVFEVTEDYVNIIGLTVKGHSGGGVYLNIVHHCNIQNNNISTSGGYAYGIYLSESSSNDIINNTVSNNWHGGIYLENSLSNSINNNTISNNVFKGIYLIGGSKNIISNNTVAYNQFDGISLEVSTSNGINNNTVSHNENGISLSVRSENNTINNNIVSHNERGIDCQVSNNASISNNIVSSNSYGIYMTNSWEAHVSNNIVSDNSYGIYLTGYLSGAFLRNAITNNNVSNNSYGIYLNDECKENTITNNNVSNNDEGIFLVDPDRRGLCSENIISYNNASDNTYGIRLFGAESNTITRNTANKNTYYGIYLSEGSSKNIITKNTASDNYNGIYLSESSDNTCYLNNFDNKADNVYSYESTNTWNSTEKITYNYSGNTYTNYLGNYWDDYDGPDDNNDGIGDTPYRIDSDNDSYPLMEPWENYFALVPSIFETGSPENPYPSIMGNHTGTITPNKTITVHKMYTYPCTGTGGHSEYVRFYGNGLNVTKTWNGYIGGYHNIFFEPPITLQANTTYKYEIRTGSYPQIIHERSLPTANGTINCTQFTDANGKIYYDWIPAIRLE
jgi:parallel beta-helix repeat protein